MYNGREYGMEFMTRVDPVPLNFVQDEIPREQVAALAPLIERKKAHPDTSKPSQRNFIFLCE